ncbi:(Fe-S)-binding protein [Ectothiorhodospira mobilis]|uniref:(Fe-S)-binding protein n=1 Tax=Ectothiorhodospira mobilis TaxID=195064 RepID=UPI001EE873A9|nr:(Fe-S)-binding protein [Ectothiorhodospira mobilis]MCG5536445.1 (Fe-S)-binding protein [Ectothiorhodospira mobilis]
MKPCPESPDPRAVLQDTDLCVKCGLCLPHCPTYRATRDEGDSPRGRITLMQGLMAGQLEDDAVVRRHLDGCLSCGACTAVCPSRVPFGRLMDAARAVLTPPRSHGRVSGHLLRHAGTRRAAAGVLRVAQRTGMMQVAGVLGSSRRPGLARDARLLPRLGPAPPRPGGRAGAAGQGAAAARTVALFTGCTGETLDAAAVRAALAVLQRLGWRVTVPREQVCCGALDQHAGRPGAAADLARRNRRAFAASEGPILSLNSGCRAHLRDYAACDDQGADIAARVTGLCTLLQGVDLGPLRLQDDPLRVAMHTPCTLRHVLGEQDALEALLRRLPGVEVLPLPENELCCGSAGTHMLENPAMADRLLAPKLEAVEALAPDVLVTANVGCAVHFAAGLKARRSKVPVLGPAELLAQRMGVLESSPPDR